jgi:serine/threonine protein kinase
MMGRGSAYTLTIVGDTSADTARANGPLRAGDVIGERYRLVARIASGGMGSVWSADHLVLGTRVAVKLMTPQLVEDEHARARFQREAQAAANLRGPHVVDIFDHGVHEDTPYIVMELLEGETLSARLKAKKKLPPDEVVALVGQIGRAIAKAHAAGVIHRDLKPENVFIVEGEHGEVAKLLDFGIAKRVIEPLAGTTTGCGAMLGTPFYMSPEQLVDAALADARADLWSLAVITYECLVGRRPFSAGSMPELAVAVLAEPIPIPSQHGAVPPGFDAWFQRATMRDADARFQDAIEMVDALASSLAATPRASVPSPQPRRSAAFVLVPTLVAAIGLAGFALAGDREAPIETPAPIAPIEPAAVEPPPPPPATTTPIAQPTTPPAATLPEPSPPSRRAATKPRKRTEDDAAPKPPRQDIRELEGP